MTARAEAVLDAIDDILEDDAWEDVDAARWHPDGDGPDELARTVADEIDDALAAVDAFGRQMTAVYAQLAAAWDQALAPLQAAVRDTLARLAAGPDAFLDAVRDGEPDGTGRQAGTVAGPG